MYSTTSKKLLTPRWYPLRRHTEQLAFRNCRKRFIGVDAGRGSGKTEIAKRKMVMELLRPVEGCRYPMYFYAAPTRPQAKRLAWRDFKDLIPPEWVANINRTDLVIQTKFGSEIHVIGMDRPHRIEGNQWCGGILDEACDHKEGAYKRSIFPTLNEYNGFCWRIGVPKRQGESASEFRVFVERVRDGGTDTEESFTWPASDIAPRSALKYALEHLDPKDYAEQFDAQWQTSGGGIFYAFDKGENVRPCTYRRNLPIVIGSDFNVDPMAWIIGHIDKEKELVEWIDELWVQDCNTDQALAMLYGRYQHHEGGFKFYGDATGSHRETSAVQSDYDAIHNHKGFRALGRTVHYPKSNPHIRDRFAACNAMLCNAIGQRRMFISPSCVRLIADLELRYYMPGTNVPADKVRSKMKRYGHISDAMGYPVYAIFPNDVELEWQSSPVHVSPGE